MEDSRAETDAAIVARTLGHRDAFGILIERYQNKLSRYIRRLGVLRDEDREDILQNVFIQVYKNLRSFDQGLSFSSWIYRIAHNETMSWFRRLKARPEGSIVDDGDAVFDMLEDGSDIEASHASEETGAHVREALLKLEQKYREVLVLRFFEEKSYEEMADILEVPVGTVATLVHRAKKRLRELVPARKDLYGI